jgi:predicted Rossmann-fold nucleotide-binding protein
LKANIASQILTTISHLDNDNAARWIQQNLSGLYGGGTVGLMGEIARTLVFLSGPDSVHGIIPSPLVKYERGPDSDVSTGGILPEYQVCVEKGSLKLRESGNIDSNLMEME